MVSVAVCVDPEKINEIWPSVSHFIKAAMKRGDLGTFASVQDDVLLGNALAWLAYETPIVQAVAVTKISITQCGYVCTIVACGGYRRAGWIGLISSIEDYAKTQGCRSVRLMGRRGWKRVLKNYSETKVILERRL